MKTKILIIASILLLNITSSKAQITYEHTYPGPQSISEGRLQLNDIGGQDYKFIYVDYSTNQLILTNIDHSPYATVDLPVPMMNEAEYIVGYVTKSLFDCDSSKFEYAIMSQSNWRNSFYIYRQDGTLLFQQDSTIAPYCFGCFTGSYEVRPIIDSPEGPKLFLMKSTDNGFLYTVDVYSLCGKLPEGINNSQNTSQTFIKIFPNPASKYLKFEIDMPNNYEIFHLLILNAEGQQIANEKINFIEKSFTINTDSYNQGVYLFSLISKNKVYQSGKFVVTN